MLLLTLEFKTLIRRPSWWIFGVVCGGLAWSLVRVMSPFAIVSIGGWGRLVPTLFVTLGFPFAAILAVGSSFHELSHREVIWCKSGAGMKLYTTKLLAIGLASTLAVALGTAVALLISRPWTFGFVLLGGEYAIIYLLRVLLASVLCAAVTMFFYSLTRSRVLTLVAVIVVFGGLILGSSPFIEHQIRQVFAAFMESTWMMDSFAVFGPAPIVLLLGQLVELGIVLSLAGGSLWMWRRYPEWKGIKANAAVIVMVVGAVLMLGSGYGTWAHLQERIASFTLRELLIEEAVLDRPYLWDRFVTPLTYIGTYTAFRLPTAAAVPTWAEELVTEGKELHRYELKELQMFAVEGRLVHRATHVSLILIYPQERNYPPELAGAVEHLRMTIGPMVDRARLWMTIDEPWEIIVAPSRVVSVALPVHAIPSGLLVSGSKILGRMGDRALWAVAWALAEATELDKSGKAYLAIHLMAAMDQGAVERALSFCRNLLTADDDLSPIARQMAVPWPRHIHLQIGRDTAQRILDHWQQGEEMGHENYIRRLLEERN